MRVYFFFCLGLALLGAAGTGLSLFYVPTPAPNSGEMPSAFGLSVLLLELAVIGALLLAAFARWRRH